MPSAIPNVPKGLTEAERHAYLLGYHDGYARAIDVVLHGHATENKEDK